MTSRAAVRSSLPYQLLLYCNGWYFALFFIVECFAFAYKGAFRFSEVLPYPKSNLAAEIILLLVLTGIEAIRNFFGQKGNLTESMAPVVASILLSLPCIATMVYFLLWQTYVLLLEVIIIAIQLVFLVLELIFGFVAVGTFARAAPLV